MFLKTTKQKMFIIRSLFSCLILILFAFSAGASSISINNSCVECHKTISPFTDEQTRLNDIRLNHTIKNISCSLECHEDIIRKTASDNFQQWSESDHSKYYVTCDDCHGGNPEASEEATSHASMKGVNDVNSTIYFKNIPDTCGKCHAEEMEHFKNTMHYQRLKAESKAPSCITCHKTHTFKVLKASELTALCSICHNQKDNIAIASVPKDAKFALDKQTEFQEELLKAKISLSEAKASGKDVTSEQMNIDKAQAVMDSIPSLWHQFNLKDFDKQMQTGIDLAKKSEYSTSQVEPTKQKIPAVGIVLIFAILAIIYLIRKR